MKKLTTLCLSSFLCTALASAGTTAYAYHGESYNNDRDTKQQLFGKNHKGQQRGFKKALKSLNLNDSQKQKVIAILEVSKPQYQALRESIHNKREQLRELSINTSTSYIEKESIHELIYQDKKSMRKLHHEQFNSIYSLLNTEQRAKLTQLKAERKERFKNRENRLTKRQLEHNNF